MTPTIFDLAHDHAVAELPDLNERGDAFELHLLVIDGGCPLAWWTNASGSWTMAAPVGKA